MANNGKVGALIDEIRELSTHDDAWSRKKAVELSRALTVALDRPEEVAVQMGFIVGTGPPLRQPLFDDLDIAVAGSLYQASH